MEKDKAAKEEDINLKHDTMEFAAPADGDDKLDTDDERYEEEGISAEELEALNDTDENEAAALIAESTDFLTDDNNMPDEDWTDDLPDNEPGTKDKQVRT